MFNFSKKYMTNKVAAPLVTTCVAGHLILVLVQSSIVSDLAIPSFLLPGNWFHVLLISIPVLAALATGVWMKQSGIWNITASLALIYSAIVVCSSSHLIGSSLNWSQVFLAPATIISLAFCAPLVMRAKAYRFVFLTLAGILALHSLLTFFFMVNGVEYFLGRNIVDGPGRVKDLFGFILPHTDGLYSNANAIGSFLMYFPAILLGEIFALGVSASLFGTLPCLAIILTALAFTFSRGAQLTVLFGLLFPAVSLEKYSTWLSCTACTIIVFLGLVVCTSVSSAPQAQSTYSPPEKSYVKQLSGRMEIWQKAVADTKNSSPLGVGLLNKTYNGNSPHNFVLANYIYFGFSGVAAILSMLALLGFQVTRRMIQHRFLIPVAGILLAACLVHGQVEYVISHPLYFSNSIFWALLGFACFSSIESGGEKKTAEETRVEAEQMVSV